ncbi:TRAP transporter substrate-binding protein DctP [Bradyrhizobium sp.]|uniref:TRAP transporter substrate-binding protein DctP n=1 Tax=Bradyrhizobium sp. TaxID=376 RepID=UPI0040376BDE
MKFRRTAMLVAALIAALSTPALASQKIVLTAASGFPRGHLFSQNFERFVEEVNKRGNGTLEIDYKGGAPTIGSPFTLGQRVQRGQFDMMSSTGPYYESTVPEALALILTERSITELRANGAIDVVQKIHADKGLFFLGRTLEGTTFHLYLRKPIEKSNLTGYRIRVAPHYQAFFGSLGATTLRSDLSEIYTFMENGSIDGFGWPLIGFLPDWLRVTKYRVEPGFYDGDIQTIINLESWNRLSPAHKKLLQETMLEFEARLPDEVKSINAAAAKAQAEANIQPLKLDAAEAKKFTSAAVETAWKAVIDRSPERGPQLRKLFSK